MTAAVLTAADGDLPDIPGQPYVSPDDLASIGPMWQQAVQQQLVPVVAEVYQTSAGVVHAQMVDATQVPTLPSVGSLAAEQYLAAASNTFEQVGDDLWATARSELLDGFEKGESIDQLAARLRASAGMTAKKAVLVARTQVLDASNAGSIATARAAGIEMNKGWLDTPDLRTRPTHLQAGTTYGSDAGMIPLGDQFTVGGYQCDRPHDPTLPASEKYNCRCSLIYGIPDDSVDDAVRDAESVPPIPGTSGVVEPLPDPYAGDLVAPALPGPGVGVPGDAAPLPGLAVRPVLEAARTTSAVQSVFAAETRRITGRFIPIRFTGSAATAREHAEGLLRGLERFPDARLGGVDAMEARGAAYAATSYNEILFSEAWTSPAARRRYLGSVASDVQDGWHVANSGNPVAIALHEFGHLLDFTTDINRGVRVRIREVVARRAAAEGVGQDVLIRREVSGYATSHTDELVAEAFTDVMINGEAASGLSREIFTLLEDAYRQAGGTVQAVVQRELAFSVPAPEALLTIEEHIARINQVAARAPRAMRQRIQEELERQAEIAPEAVAAVRSIRIATQREWDDLIRRGGATERTRAMRFEHDIIFSPEWQTDRRAVDRAHRFDYENDQLAWSFPGYEFKNLDIAAGVLRHELGHTVASRWPGREILSRDREFTVGGQWTVAQRQRLLHPLADELKVRHPRPDEDIADWFNDSEVQRAVTARISQYAAKDLGEALGEIWAVFSGRGVEATALARRIGAIMREEWLPDRLGAQLVAVPGSTPAVSLAARTVPQLRALAKERGITIPPGSKKADIVRLLDEGPTPGPSAAPSGLLTPAQFEARISAAKTGTAAENLPPVMVRIDASAGSDVGKWRAVEATGLQGPQSELLSAATSRVRTSGLANPRLRGETARDIKQRLQLERAGLGPTPEEAAKQAARADREIAALDRAMEQSRLPSDAVVWRVGRPTGVDIPDGSAVGLEWTDLGFVGTSARRDVAESFAANGRILMRILAPEDTPAIGIAGGGEAEVLLARNLRFRVVGESRTVSGGRLLDVEIVPASAVPVAAPVVEVPLAKRTVAQLRALAADRKITVPKGAKKPDIVRLLEAPPLTEAEQRAAVRALARETNTLIEQTSATARVLAEVDELLAKKASASTIREAIADALAEPGQLFAGADPAVLAALRAVASDPVKLRAAVTRLGGKAKIKPVSKAGAKVTFDADTMEGVGGIDIEAGARVTVVRRGSTVTLPDGTVMQLEKARVTPVTAPVKAAKAVPVKRAPAAKKAPAAKATPPPVKAAPRPVAYQLPPGVTDQDAAELRLALKRRQPIEGMPGADNAGLVERLATENNADRILDTFQDIVDPSRRMTTAQLQADLAARAKAAFADRAVATNVDNARLEEILTGGRFKTQFETGRSGGVFQPEERRLREEQWFGIPADAAPETRPIYGYLVTSGDGKAMVDVYGGARIVFRTDVRERTTAMVGDSMEHILEGRPAAVDDPDWYAFTVDDWPPVFAKLDRNYDGPAFNKKTYIEAQIHGGVTVDDIAEVIFTSRPSPELVALLRERGIPWRMRRR